MALFRGKKRRSASPVALGPTAIGLAALCLIAIVLGAAAPAAQGESEPPEVPVVDVPAVTPIPTQEPLGNRWWLILVNYAHPLDADYAVPELTEMRSEMAVDSRIAVDLKAMLSAAREEGFEPLICAAYRSMERQQELYDAKVRSFLDDGMEHEEAEDAASRWVAVPGCSEHQTGLAVDIVSMDYQILDAGQAETPLQQWLSKHCAEYGFILRYPPEKREITRINFEPWHYRYVGREVARQIMDSGITFEEYWQ